MAGELTLNTMVLAFVGGILPALFWLWFWTREDRLHPEPKAMLTLSFLAGMVGVAIAYPLEKWTAQLPIAELFGPGSLLLTWAFIEEIAKLIMFFVVVYRNADFDEPVDAMMYMITIALGFSALENGLFLIDPVADGHTTMALLLGNFRFVGATLLHVVASATIGIFLGLSFYREPIRRSLAVTLGFLTATLLHAAFNFFIIQSNEESIYLVFGFLWFLVVLLLVFFEKVKVVSIPAQNKHFSPYVKKAPIIF